MANTSPYKDLGFLGSIGVRRSLTTHAVRSLRFEVLKRYIRTPPTTTFMRGVNGRLGAALGSWGTSDHAFGKRRERRR